MPNPYTYDARKVKYVYPRSSGCKKKEWQLTGENPLVFIKEWSEPYPGNTISRFPVAPGNLHSYNPH